MLYSTLKKVTAIDKIKANALKIWKRSHNVTVYKPPET